jgi:hypothetical protein
LKAKHRCELNGSFFTRIAFDWSHLNYSPSGPQSCVHKVCGMDGKTSGNDRAEYTAGAEYKPKKPSGLAQP